MSNQSDMSVPLHGPELQKNGEAPARNGEAPVAQVVQRSSLRPHSALGPGTDVGVLRKPDKEVNPTEPQNKDSIDDEPIDKFTVVRKRTKRVQFVENVRNDPIVEKTS
jgi:hypothetical protein